MWNFLTEERRNAFWPAYVICHSLLSTEIQRTNTKRAYRRCRSFRGFRIDVGCCGKTVVRTGIFSRSFSAIASPCSFLRTWTCFGIRCSATPVAEIWRGPKILAFLKDLGGDVEERFLESRVRSRSPLRPAPGSGRVISPSAKFYSSRTTSFAANLPTVPKNVASVQIPSLGHILQGNHAGVYGGLLGKAWRYAKVQ